MRSFEYVSPSTTEQAVALLSGSAGESEVLAGGTDLISLMKDGVVSPRRLVNIKSIGDLRRIALDAQGLELGALVTIQELLDDERVAGGAPALVQAAAGIRSPQIRGVGTIGGDLCQRPRCWYFRAGHGLLALGADGRSLVVEGDNRYHAILGNAGPAYFVSPSSLAPALVALEATMTITGPAGARTIPVEDFFRTPETEGEREHDLAPREIVTWIRIPSSSGKRSATYEVRPREGLDWPLATASVALMGGAGATGSARVVMGHVAPIPWRSREAEAALAGKTPGEDAARAAAEAAVAPARALSGNAHKIRLASVAVKRAILAAAGGAR